MHGVVQHYKQLVWDPDAHFKIWFSDPTKFRGVLQTCGAIVSGSQILQFLDRTRYPDSDMDIFLRVGGIPVMAQWLRHQGYALNSVSPDYLEDQVTKL
ncbi:hypothetical protein B0H17DRAFT_942010 [Mycena rosella]|uniref:Uncharacterized protein n=1 Tax=Mycena rosella TaxID=1033263 RepID=A0AAD7D7P1_MYCRO|nr:hypothetical protein B0H17DRAFT_942010 [Mycena rosella]